MTIAECRYPAFISYSHKDAAAAKWLHGSLERFRIDNELIGQPSPLGPISKRVAPIFRDRADFADGHSPTEQTLTAVEAGGK